MKKNILIIALVIFFLLPSLTYGNPIGISFNPNIDSLKKELTKKIDSFIERKKLEAKTEYDKYLVKEGFYSDSIIVDDKGFSISIYGLGENEKYICIHGDDIATVDIRGEGQPDIIVQFKNPPRFPLPDFEENNLKELKFVLNKVTLAFTLMFENDVMDIINERKTTGNVSKLKVKDYAFLSKQLMNVIFFTPDLPDLR